MNYQEYKVFSEKYMEQFVKEYRLQHEKFTQKQLAEVISQMLLAGDFTKYVNVLHEQQIVYLPFARQQALEFERDDLVKRLHKLEAAAEVFAREAGYLERIEDAEARADAADAQARNARDTAFFGTGK